MAEKNFGHSCAWININSEEISDFSTIYQTYQIDKEMVEYALDENERAHIEYCRPKETLVVIYNVIKQTKRENRYETVPMTFIVRKDQIITISNRHNEYIVEAMRKELEERPDVSLFTFLFSSLMMITENYFPKIESLKKEQELVSLKLRHKTTKKNLFALSDLEIGIVYLVSATKQNAIVLEQLKNQSLFKKLEFTEEALTEIARRALKRKMGARGLRAIIEHTMLDIMFELPSQNNIKEITITKDAIDNYKKAEIEYK